MDPFQVVYPFNTHGSFGKFVYPFQDSIEFFHRTNPAVSFQRPEGFWFAFLSKNEAI